MAAGLGPGQWICRGQWDHQGWPEGRRPGRRTLDPVTPRNPVLLRRIDGRIAVANALALERAGITRDTAEPVGGAIERDPCSGEPTGILVDAAVDLVDRQVPEPSPAERLEAARQATRHAASLGVTSVLGLGDLDDLAALQALHAAGELLTRVTMGLPAERVELAQALSDCTAGSAFAEFAEDRKGLIATGMMADLVILDRDLLAVSPQDLQGTRSTATIVGGRVVYERQSGLSGRCGTPRWRY